MRSKKFDSIIVVVDKLTIEVHFIPFKYTYKTSDIAWSFIKDIFSLHGLLRSIILNRDVKFTLNFWKELL